jgi:hypothetical protein
MNDIDNPETQMNESEQSQLSSASEQPVPASHFPREYVLAVFIKMQDARGAADSLRNAGFNGHEILVLESPDFVNAVGRDQLPSNIVTSASHDMYLLEANRGRAFLAVRPTSINQLMLIRDALAPHGAYLVRYIDTWSQSELLP